MHSSVSRSTDRKKKFLVLFAAVTMSISALAAPINAAQTRNLPEGEHLYSIECDLGANPGQLYKVDTSTAVLTAIGVGGASASCATDAAWDPTTNRAYWVGLDGQNKKLLISTDVATGLSSTVGELTSNPSPLVVLNDFYGLMIGLDGSLYGIAQDPDGVAIFLTINKSNAVFNYVSDLRISGSNTTAATYSMSFNPKDSQFYFILNTTNQPLYKLDVSTGNATLVASLDASTAGLTRWYGLAIDSSGTMWTTGTRNSSGVYYFVGSATIANYSTAGVIQWSTDQTSVNGNLPWGSQSNFITYGNFGPQVNSSSSSPTANAYAQSDLGSIYFAPGSSRISAAAKIRIQTMIQENPNGLYKVTGYVQKSRTTKNDQRLSEARARAVEKYLLELGAGVHFTVVVEAGKVPASDGSKSTARRATLYSLTPVVR